MRKAWSTAPFKSSLSSGERTILELNRILADGGIALISLTPSLFRDEQAFARFRDVFPRYFGFEIVAGDTGRARSEDHGDEEVFEGYVLTLRKVRTVRLRPESLPREALLALNFSRKAPGKDAERERFIREPGIPEPPPPGAYHEEFSVEGNPVTYTTPESEVSGRELHLKRKQRYRSACAAIQKLIDKHGSMNTIPREELLAISLEDIDEAEQEVRNRYFRALLDRYDGRIDLIPIEELSKESPVILVRRRTKVKGWYLVLATIDPETKKLGTYGKRYFCETDFPRGASAVQ